MKVTDLELSGLKLVELKTFEDHRGFFVERFHENKFGDLGLPNQFRQDNHSRSKPGVIRGLHFQTDPAQGKLVGAIRGRIWDVAVDIRPESPSFGQHYGIELSDANQKLLWIPSGFAHGFCVLGDEPADVLYKIDAPYNAQTESGILWNDPELSVPWPLKESQIVLSERDQALQSFSEYKKNPPPFKELGS